MKVNVLGQLYQLKPRRYLRRGYLPFGARPATLPALLADGS